MKGFIIGNLRNGRQIATDNIQRKGTYLDQLDIRRLFVSLSKQLNKLIKSIFI